MKILQVNCVHNTGSTGKITYEVHKALTQSGVDSVVCYGRGEKVQEEKVYKTCGELYSHINHFLANLTGVMYGGCFFSTNRLISIIKKEKPDIVHLHCINGYFVNIYRLIGWLKKKHVKTVVTLHAEFMYTGGCGYALECNQWKDPQGCTKCPRYRTELHSKFFDRSSTMWKRMNQAFAGFDDGIIVTSVSPWLMHRAESSPILGSKPHRVVMNGIDVGVFHPYASPASPHQSAQLPASPQGEAALSSGERVPQRGGCGEHNTSDSNPCAALKKELNIGTEKVIFHATASFTDDPNHLKGGWYLLELAKRMPQVTFVVAGSAQEGIRVPENVRVLGRVADQTKLAQLYSMADLTLLTSQKETFSMVTAESLCCGTPVVGFEAGAPEIIALPQFSQFVAYGDLDKLHAAANHWLNQKDSLSDIAQTAQAKYRREEMSRSYLAVYEELVKSC